MRQFRRWGVAIALVSALGCGTANAVAVSYTATDLADVVSGQDLWSVTYRLSGSFGAFEGINLLYPYAQYSNLNLASAPNPADWSVLVTQPDAGFLADGLIGVSANAAASVSDLPFTVEFVWLGTGEPGSLGYEIFDANFSITGGGQTVSGTQNPPNPVPEPGSLALVAAALAAVSRRRSPKKRQATN